MLTYSLLLLTSLSYSTPSYDALVDPTNDAAYSTIKNAVSDAPTNSEQPYIIKVAAGDYYEKIIINKDNIQLHGEGAEKTRLYFDAYSGQPVPDKYLSEYPEIALQSRETWGTSLSATLIVRELNFHAQDITIENTFDFPNNDKLAKDDPNKKKHSQAVALMLDDGSDKALFKRVSLKGYQDTLFADAGRSAFIDSSIAGHVDFIFGAGMSLFFQSAIHTKDRPNKSGTIGYITAPSTNINQDVGFVFLDSRLTKDKGVPPNSVGLGRPWHPTTTFSDGRYGDPDAIGHALFINTWMDDHIQKHPWHNMGAWAKDGTRMTYMGSDARFFEFQSSGPGAHQSTSRRQLNEVQMARFNSIEKILGDWDPVNDN
jgi:pectinesterase